MIVAEVTRRACANPEESYVLLEIITAADKSDSQGPNCIRMTLKLQETVAQRIAYMIQEVCEATESEKLATSVFE